MNTNHRAEAVGGRPHGHDARPSHVAGERQANGRNTNLLLLISDDAMLGKTLRDTAEQMGLLLAQSTASGAAPWQLRALRPGAVLLDLDLPSETAWDTADRLLELEICPPLILVTARREQFDARTAFGAGTMVDKSAEPVRLLLLAAKASAQSGFGQVERNSIQRIFIRWLRPCGWSVPVTPAYRFWGLNE
jgi:CheY-like chemotaxis protein